MHSTLATEGVDAVTVAQAIRVAGAGRPVSHRERAEAIKALREAIACNRAHSWGVLAKCQEAHLAKLMESRP